MFVHPGDSPPSPTPSETSRASFLGIEIDVGWIEEQLLGNMEFSFGSHTTTATADPVKPPSELLADCSSASRSMARRVSNVSGNDYKHTILTPRDDDDDEIDDEKGDKNTPSLDESSTTKDTTITPSSDNNDKTPNPTRQKPRRSRSSVSFHSDVSVCHIEELREEDRASMYYTKEDIENFRNEQYFEKQREAEEEAKRIKEEKRLAKQRSREERKKRLAERRASRNNELLGLTKGSKAALPKIKRRPSGNLGLLANFLNKDDDNKSPMERAEEDRDAISVF